MPVYGYLQEEVSRRPTIRSRLSLPGDPQDLAFCDIRWNSNLDATLTSEPGKGRLAASAEGGLATGAVEAIG